MDGAKEIKKTNDASQHMNAGSDSIVIRLEDVLHLGLSTRLALKIKISALMGMCAI